MSVEEEISVLKSYARIYGKHKLYKSQTSIKAITKLLEKSSNLNLLKKEFNKLKRNSLNEFRMIEQRYAKDQYVGRCNLFLNEIFVRLINTKKDNIIQNFTETLNIVNTAPEKIAPWVDNMRALIQTPARSMREVYHTFNVEYQTKVEGIFRNDLRLCYIWLQYSNYTKIKSSDINSWDLNKLKQSFQKNAKGAIPFEGHKNHLRNAITHVSFTYNEVTKTMEYRDEKAGWIKEYNVFEIMDLSERLMIFNFLVTFYRGLLFTFDIAFCPTRTLTKKIKDFHPETV